LDCARGATKRITHHPFTTTELMEYSCRYGNLEIIHTENEHKCHKCCDEELSMSPSEEDLHQQSAGWQEHNFEGYGFEVDGLEEDNESE
jgi:hypothetical protein